MLTDALANMSDTLRRVHKQFGDIAKLPYRKRRLTAYEQRKRFESLTDEDIARLIQEHGEAEVQQMLSHYMQAEMPEEEPYNEGL